MPVTNSNYSTIKKTAIIQTMELFFSPLCGLQHVGQAGSCSAVGGNSKSSPNGYRWRLLTAFANIFRNRKETATSMVPRQYFTVWYNFAIKEKETVAEKAPEVFQSENRRKIYCRRADMIQAERRMWNISLGDYFYYPDLQKATYLSIMPQSCLYCMAATWRPRYLLFNSHDSGRNYTHVKQALWLSKVVSLLSHMMGVTCFQTAVEVIHLLPPLWSHEDSFTLLWLYVPHMERF